MKELIESTKKVLSTVNEAPRTSAGFDEAEFNQKSGDDLEDFLIELAVWMQMSGKEIKDASGDDAMLKAAKHISEAGKAWKKRLGN